MEILRAWEAPLALPAQSISAEGPRGQRGVSLAPIALRKACTNGNRYLSCLRACAHYAGRGSYRAEQGGGLRRFQRPIMKSFFCRFSLSIMKRMLVRKSMNLMTSRSGPRIPGIRLACGNWLPPHGFPYSSACIAAHPNGRERVLNPIPVTVARRFCRWARAPRFAGGLAVRFEGGSARPGRLR